MSATNGKHHRIDPEAYLTGRKGASYRPYSLGSGYGLGVYDGRPAYTWAQVERMRCDPQVIFSLRILRSPLWRVKWQVRTKHSKIEAFVNAMLRRIWTRALRKIAKSFHIYGVHAGEFTFAHEGGLIVFSQLDDFNPRDVKPLEFQRGAQRGKLAGIHVRNVAPEDSQPGFIGGGADIVFPHAWWFAGDAEYGLHYGRPHMAGAFEPWLEKRGRNGAIDARRLAMRKAIYSGPRVYYPPGSTDYGPADGSDPHLVGNQDVARQIGEMLENGSTVAVPNTVHPSERMAGERAWIVEDSKPIGEMPQLLEYPKELDREILKGFSIPPELVEAASVGSGYNGRAHPVQAFFSMIDEDAALIIDALDLQCIRGLVALNFGKASYEIVPQSLAVAVEQDPSKATEMIQGDGEEQEQEQSQAQQKQPPFRMSHESHPRLAERIRALAEEDYADMGPIQLSWAAQQTARGTIKAVGAGEHSGKVLYGDAARKALAVKEKAGAKPEATGGKKEAAKPAAAPKGEKQSVEATVAHVAKLRENFTIEGLGHLAHVLQGHTVAEMGQIKSQLGIKASGSKVELAKKIAQRALADAEPGEKPPEPKQPKAKAVTGDTYKGPHDKGVVDRANRAWGMASVSAFATSELNAVMVELAKADTGTWLAATKAMGFGHLPDTPKNRRDMARLMFDRRGQSMRNAIADKDDVEAGETTNRKAMAGWQRSNDEPLLQADEVMAKAKEKGKSAKPAAAQQSPHADKGKALGESMGSMKDGSEADALGKQLEDDMRKLTPEQAREYMRAAGFTPSKTETKPSVVRKLKGHIDAVARSRAQTSNIG